MHPLLILIIGVLVVFVLILRLKINAFLALITASTIVGVLSSKVDIASVMPKVAGSFGTVCGKIGIVIALAAIIGECLLESGAADKLTRVSVRLIGRERASLSLLGSGYLLAIPVFFDTVFYLLIPLARTMGMRTGRNYLLYVMAISAGGIVTQCLVPPTPGPLAMAATLGIDLGVMILAGIIIGVPMAVAGWLFSVYVDRRLNLPLRETPGATLAELQEVAKRSEEELPGFLSSLLPILLPVLLISSNTLLGAVAPGTSAARLAAFIGDANFALLVSAAIALGVLAHQKGYTLRRLAEPVERAFTSAGLIILITAGGGAFGAMLVEADVGRTLGTLATRYHMPLLLLSFLLAALFKIAQGSSTVSMITVSSIVAPLITAAPPSFHPVYVACVIGSGAMLGAWMNDSAFWIYKQMSGFTETETLQTWTPLLAVIGITGFIAAQIAAVLLPLK